MRFGPGIVVLLETFGGARRDRTADLYNAIVALSQLSYGPENKRSTIAQKHLGVNYNSEKSLQPGPRTHARS